MINPATEERTKFPESRDNTQTVASKYQKAREAQTSSSSDLIDWRNNLKRRITAIEKFMNTLEARKEEGNY